MSAPPHSDTVVRLHDAVLYCTVLYSTLLFTMEQDVSSEEHRANPDGGNSLGPGGSPSDRGPRLAGHENKVLGPGTCCSLNMDKFLFHRGIRAALVPVRGPCCALFK